MATHEIGHALGANHSGVIGATMNFATSPIGSFADVADATAQSTLSSDDIAFVNAVYPASSAPKAGAIRGTVAFSNGHPILAGLVIALNASTGTTIGGMTSMTDGTFTISPVPPGEYVVYVQPLDDPRTFRTQPSASVDGLVPVRFNVDVGPSARRALISVGVVNGTDAVVRTGGFVVMPRMFRFLQR